MRHGVVQSVEVDGRTWGVRVQPGPFGPRRAAWRVDFGLGTIHLCSTQPPGVRELMLAAAVALIERRRPLGTRLPFGPFELGSW